MGKMKENTNFDDTNFASVEKLILKEMQDTSREKRAYTMLQDNLPCDVEVTLASRDSCTVKVKV